MDEQPQMILCYQNFSEDATENPSYAIFFQELHQMKMFVVFY